MNPTIIYRDKSFKNRILVPLMEVGEHLHCIEIINWPERDGVHLNAKKYYIPIQLLRHYRREEL